MMKTTLAAFAFLACAACGAYTFPGGSNATGTVTGTVRVYPCAPVEQQGEMCKGLIGAGFVLEFTGGPTNGAASVDDNGNYAITLPAGTYKVTLKSRIARIVNGPATVDVPSGGTVQADYVVDSGIRAPGPAAVAS